GHRVHYDNKMAAKLAVEHFLERKRKRIGMLIGDTQKVLSFNERLQGFKETMKKHGLDANNKNIFEFKYVMPDLGVVALDFFLKNKIDAIYVAASDPHMLELLDEIRKRGIKVPDDIAIISQDDMGLPLAANVTAIRQPGIEMGKKAAEIAIWAINENDFKNMRDELFYPELIVRGST
ncbi:MAG: LacI family transcriptional regulator, partial [Candidatus Goldbacteria bacterium]|nr:LacI family transcriptional regulator [Candidatus Goldiibacteriota bacterium]